MESYKIIYFFIPSILFVAGLVLLPNNEGVSSITKYLIQLGRFLYLIVAVPLGCSLIGVLLSSPIAHYQDLNSEGMMWSQGTTTLVCGVIAGLLFGISICFYILTKTKFPR